VYDDGSREQALLNYATSAAKTQQQRRMKPATSNGHDDDSKPAIVNLDDFTDAEKQMIMKQLGTNQLKSIADIANKDNDNIILSSTDTTQHVVEATLAISKRVGEREENSEIDQIEASTGKHIYRKSIVRDTSTSNSKRKEQQKKKQKTSKHLLTFADDEDEDAND